MRFAPIALLILRFLLGPLLLIDALDGKTGLYFVVGMVVALLSDVFDGMIAKRLGVATSRLREADSWVDTFFYLCVLGSAWLAYRDIVLVFAVPIGVMLGAQLLSLMTDWLKYRRFASYHAYSARAAGLALVAAAVALFGFGSAGWLLWLAIGLAILSHLEKVIITLLLPRWTHDVRSAGHALRLRYARVPVESQGA